VDQDQKKIDLLNQGGVPIYEPGLDTLIARNRAAGRLTFTTQLEKAVPQAGVIFIAVGTPTALDGQGADLTYVFQALDQVAKYLNKETVLVVKSTVPVGTNRKVQTYVNSLNLPFQVHVVSNPEFLREGAAIQDFMRPDRVIVGCESDYARQVMAQIYRPLYLLETPILYTDFETAEVIKYAANAFLATKITFINEIANLCEAAGANVQDVSQGMGLDKRISKLFLHASPGYGGSCFPKDTRALVHTAQAYQVPLPLVETVIASNDARKKSMADRIIQACGGQVKGKTIGILGLTFKPETDDMRESPSLDIVPALMQAGAHVQAYDPKGMDHAKALMPNLTCVPDMTSAAQGAHALVILTEWNAFRALDFAQLKTIMAEPCVVDLRNIYPPQEMARHGMTYFSIGRPPIYGAVPLPKRREA
jgi:UDPglucose 6-dehydrogenase